MIPQWAIVAAAYVAGWGIGIWLFMPRRTRGLRHSRRGSTHES
jgi:hypothetical protein